MKGLARPYGVSDGETGETLLSVAYNSECDVVVAVATLGDGDPAVVDAKLVAFLSQRADAALGEEGARPGVRVWSARVAGSRRSPELSGLRLLIP